MSFTGIIIEESLADKKPLQEVTIIDTKIEPVTPEDNTPWLTQWTLHTIQVLEEKAEAIAATIQQSLDKTHPWYVDFNNEQYHYIIYHDKVFKIDVTTPKREAQYKEASKHGIKLGIPKHQVTFIW